MDAVKRWHEWTNSYWQFHGQSEKAVKELWDPESGLEPLDYFRNQFAMYMATLPDVLKDLVSVAQQHNLDPSPIIDLIGNWQASYRDPESFDSLADAVWTVVKRIEFMDCQPAKSAESHNQSVQELVSTNNELTSSETSSDDRPFKKSEEHRDPQKRSLAKLLNSRKDEKHIDVATEFYGGNRAEAERGLGALYNFERRKHEN